jgi:hypothetical protein
VQPQYLLPNPFLIAGFMFFGLLANVAIWKTVSEVNAHLPDDQAFSWWWWTLGKYMRLWKEHKRLCPESRWKLYSLVSFPLGVAFMVLTALSVHVPKPPM